MMVMGSNIAIMFQAKLALNRRGFWVMTEGFELIPCLFRFD